MITTTIMLGAALVAILNAKNGKGGGNPPTTPMMRQ